LGIDGLVYFFVPGVDVTVVEIDAAVGVDGDGAAGGGVGGVAGGRRCFLPAPGPSAGDMHSIATLEKI